MWQLCYKHSPVRGHSIYIWSAQWRIFVVFFWQDVKARLEAGDLGEDMLVQLGSHISSLAYKEKKLPVIEYMEE